MTWLLWDCIDHDTRVALWLYQKAVHGQDLQEPEQPPPEPVIEPSEEVERIMSTAPTRSRSVY